jgi:hypothetical protein
MDHDERLAVWRHQHMLMAGRQIGRRPGTGGSEGMAYLDTTLAQRLYPVLGSEVDPVTTRDDCRPWTTRDEISRAARRVRPERDEIYLDGNSLGPVSASVRRE